MVISVCLGIKNTGSFVWVNLPIKEKNEKNVINYILKLMPKNFEEKILPEDITIIDISVNSISTDIYNTIHNIFVNEGLHSFLILNEFMNKFQYDLDEEEKKHVECAFALDSALLYDLKEKNIDSFIEYILTHYIYIPEVSNMEELGEYVYENYFEPINEFLTSYIDFEALGKDFALEKAGKLTEYGFIYGE